MAMLTHENLVEAVYGDNHSWSCLEPCQQPYEDGNCWECIDVRVTEYENSLREEALAEALKPYDVEDIEGLIRNVKNKTIAPFEREIANLNRVEWTEQNMACFVFRIQEIIEQMKGEQT